MITEFFCVYYLPYEAYLEVLWIDNDTQCMDQKRSRFKTVLIIMQLEMSINFTLSFYLLSKPLRGSLMISNLKQENIRSVSWAYEEIWKVKRASNFENYMFSIPWSSISKYHVGCNLNAPIPLNRIFLTPTFYVQLLLFSLRSLSAKLPRNLSETDRL